MVALLIGGFPVVPSSEAEAAPGDLSKGYHYPSEEGIKDPNTHGIIVGEVVKNGGDIKISGSEEVQVAGLHPSGDKFYVIITEVTVERIGYNNNVIQTRTGMALHYSEINNHVDNGYVLVDRTEASQWIKVFNGDEAYVFSGGVVNEYTVRLLDGSTYKAYNLAEIAAASGGAGGEFGFTPAGGNTYQKYNKFKATVRPGGQVSTDKPAYTRGETVTIRPTGSDYSIYDKGFYVANLYVKNLDGTEQEQLYAAPHAKLLTIPTQTFIPTQIGTYEVGLVITDAHGRTVDGSPDMATSRTITTTFEVLADIDCDVQTSTTKATLKISGESDELLSSGDQYELPEGKNTITLVFPTAGNLRVNGADYGSTGTSFTLTLGGETDIYFESASGSQCWAKTFVPQTVQGPDCENSTAALRFLSDERDSMLQSGSPSIKLKRNDGGFRFEAPKTGTFYFSSLSGSEDWVVAATNTTWYEPSVATGQSFGVKFISKDGTLCWEKQFYWEGLESCPVVWEGRVGSNQISSGETIPVNFGGSLTLHATYDDGEDSRTPAHTVWVVKKPNGTIYKYRPSYDFDHHDRIYYSPVPSAVFKIPNPYEEDFFPPDQKFAFDQAGRYEIWHEYRPHPSNDWDENCSWKAYIDVSPFQCSDVTVDAESGASKLPMTVEPDGSYKLQLATGAARGIRFEVQHLGDRNNHLVGDWVLKSGSTIVETSEEPDPDFYYYFEAHDEPTTYTLEITTNLFGKTCRKTVIIEIVEEDFSCDKISFAARVDGEDTEIVPKGQDFELSLEIGDDHNVLIWLDYAGPPGELKYADWTLVEDSTQEERKYVSRSDSFGYQFPNNLETYTLTVEIHGMNGEKCIKKILIRPEAPDCTKTEVELHVNDRETLPISGRGTTSDPYIVLMQKNSHDYVSLDGYSYFNGREYKARWLLIKVNRIWDDEFDQHWVKGIHGEEGDTWELYVTFHLNGKECTQVFRLQIGEPPPPEPEPPKDCSQVYLHFFDSQNLRWMHDVGGQTITIKADHLDYFGVFVTTSPDDHLSDADTKSLDADFTGSTRPNEFPEVGVYAITNVAPGTYQVRATVDEPGWPGCVLSMTVVVGPDAPPADDGPGGPVDGGQIRIRVYDSDNRLLTGTADGVWEREPARIEVIIDQTAINRAFAAIDGEIAAAVSAKAAELRATYPAPEYEDVTVTPSPTAWNSRSNPQTQWPASISMRINGPGVDQTVSMSPRLPTQSHVYPGTTVPTQTTWRADLHGENYGVRLDGFAITVPYRIVLNVSYQQCRMESPGEDEDGNPLPEEKTCVPGQQQVELGGVYTIQVDGTQTSFEVFEPNARGVLAHTAEWTDYHSRDRYPDSGPDDFYAGERILTRVQLEARHRHPVSGIYPRLTAAASWISESGRQSTPLANQLSLVPVTAVQWAGPMLAVPKLGMREAGVDTPPMGDKQKGFQQGSRYHVCFTVQFAFGVQKGYVFPQKSNGTGHHPDDYRASFDIIANAWERQGIRNHTSH